MKRLYNCQAWYDDTTLISYNTTVIKIVKKQDGFYTVIMRNYRSNTTLSHIRKFIKLLREKGQAYLSNKVQATYDKAFEFKNSRYVVNDILGYYGTNMELL